MSAAAPKPPKHPPPWFVHAAWRVHRALNRLSGGRALWTTSNKRGWGALRLTTTGRRSGQERSVIIGYLEEGRDLVSIAMNGWDEGHPAWWLNLEAHPDAVVRLADQQSLPVRARRSEGQERDRLWQRWVEVDPQLLAHADRRSTETPVVVFERRDERMTSSFDSYPEPPDLTDEELALQRRRARRMGLALLALCLVLAAATLVVLLSLNSEDRDEGRVSPTALQRSWRERQP